VYRGKKEYEVHHFIYGREYIKPKKSVALMAVLKILYVQAL